LAESSLLRSPVTNSVLLPWYFKLWLLLERTSPRGRSALLCLRGNRACNRTKMSLRRTASAVQQPSCSPTSSRSVTESRNLLCTNITLFKREKVIQTTMPNFAACSKCWAPGTCLQKRAPGESPSPSVSAAPWVPPWMSASVAELFNSEMSPAPSETDRCRLSLGAV
jgi:hypothetical protein